MSCSSALPPKYDRIILLVVAYESAETQKVVHGRTNYLVQS